MLYCTEGKSLCVVWCFCFPLATNICAALYWQIFFSRRPSQAIASRAKYCIHIFVLQKQAIWPICATAATQFSQYSISVVALWVADVWTADVWVANFEIILFRSEFVFKSCSECSPDPKETIKFLRKNKFFWQEKG